MLPDAWRLAVGTLTAVPVRPPVLVDRRRAGVAMVLAPVAALPLGLAVAVVAVLGRALDLSPLVVALLALGALAMGNRGFHLDGLSDVADGMAASFDPDRSLAVMKTGTSGPAGGVAVFLVLGLQAAGLVGVLSLPGAWAPPVLAGAAVCASRAALTWCCLQGLRPARPDGLGRTYTQTVSPLTAGMVWVALVAVLSSLCGWAGLDWWRGGLAVVLATVAVGILLLRAVRRFGGVTGDVFGAAVELSLAALLVALS